MNRENWNQLSEEGIKEALTRFKRSLAIGRKSYFDVSEFEGIVDYLLDEGDVNTSEIAALQGIQIHPGAVPLQLKYAQVLISKGKYQNALKYLNLAEQVELTNPDVHLLKGSACLIMGNEKDAKAAFGKALKNADNEKDDILYHIGSAYIQSGDIDTAINYFEKALEVNPENELALYDLGFFSDQEGKYQKSIEYYNRYLDIDPFNFSIWFNLGISYNKAGEYEKAIEAYEYALTLNEEFDQSLFNLGNAYANTGNYSKAIQKYLEFLELEPENDDAHSYIGECYLNLEDYFKAEKFYKKAAKLNPRNETAMFGVGVVMYMTQRYKQSIQYIKKALRIDPSNEEYWIAIARVFTENDQPEEAADALEAAMELEVDNADLWIGWVDYYQKYFSLDDAISILHEGIEKCDDSVLKYRMVILLLQKKKVPEACDWFKVAINHDFLNVNYLFETYPPALKNKQLRKLMDEYRRNNNL